jgi:RNA polymerase sigma factor (sigma-70 family)
MLHLMSLTGPSDERPPSSLAGRSGPSDRALVARVVVDDDRHAFAALVRRHHGAVRAFARRLANGDNARADDVAQDTFLAAWRHLSTWRAEGELVSWLLKLCFRAHLTDARRAHHKREGLADDANALPPGTTDANDPTERRDVVRAMAALSEMERASIALVFQQGLTHEEAARVLDVPLGTLKSHVARGKEKLKPLLAAYNSEAA